MEKEKNKVLQVKLERLKATQRQQVNNLQSELEKQIMSHKDTVTQGKLLVQTLRDEQEALRQEIEEEIRLVKKNSAEQEMILWKELEELKTQLSLQLSGNLELCEELKGTL